MENTEKGLFLNLFNRNGQVLDFSIADFDAFTMQSIGVGLCAKYKQSKGKSLNAFIYDSSNDLSTKLLLDLLDYYETRYIHFKQERDGKNDFYSSCMTNEEYGKLYIKCKAIAERIKTNNFSKYAEQTVKEAFSNEYINKQLTLMLDNIAINPTESIGKAKELIESCCKTILEERSVEIDKKWDIVRLVDETVKLLKITPRDIPDNVPESVAIKTILGNLKNIAVNIATLRNAYGSGHGKSASYKGLEERHAKLAVGSSITLVNFLWDSHLRMLKKNDCTIV